MQICKTAQTEPNQWRTISLSFSKSTNLCLNPFFISPLPSKLLSAQIQLITFFSLWWSVTLWCPTEGVGTDHHWMPRGQRTYPEGRAKMEGFQPENPICPFAVCSLLLHPSIHFGRADNVGRLAFKSRHQQRDREQKVGVREGGGSRQVSLINK